MTSLPSTDLNVYLKKTVELTLKRQQLTFAVSQSLFSSHQVDLGSLQLLKTLEDLSLPRGSRILDLGCGYGPLGLTLARLHEGTEVHLVDRDALATAFTQLNAERNHLTGTLSYGSLAYDEIDARDFDLIVANIPGKAGKRVIRAMLLDAQALLAPQGIVAIVVVAPLEELVAKTLDAPEIEILLHQTSQEGPARGYAIFHYRFTSTEPTPTWSSGFERGIYDREEITFVLDGMTLTIRTAHGLPEFDTLSYTTQALIKAIGNLGMDTRPSLAVFNPGQGHIPAVLWRVLSPQSVALIDRDLLSLRYAAMNLIGNGCEASAITVHHQVDLLPASTSPDLVVGVLREDEGPVSIEHGLIRVADALQPGAQLLIAAGSTPITRVLDAKELGRRLRLVKRKRSKGQSTALLQRR